MQQPIGLLLSLRIPGGFDARKPPGDRMLRISGQPDDLASVDLDVQGAGIGAIQSAHGGKDANGGWGFHGFPPLSRVHQACAIETIIGMSFSLLVKRWLLPGKATSVRPESPWVPLRVFVLGS